MKRENVRLCPSCGWKPAVIKSKDYRVMCKNYNCEKPVQMGWIKDEKSAIHIWNCRVSDYLSQVE